MLIDSGSPVVLIDPSLFGTTPPTTAAKIPTTVNLGLLDASGQPVVVIDNTPVLQVSNAMMDALGFGGILGGNVMREFSVQLDYSAPMMEGFCLGCTASTDRTDVQLPGGVVPFTLEGGRPLAGHARHRRPGEPHQQPRREHPADAHSGDRLHRRDRLPIHRGYRRDGGVAALDRL